MERADDRTPEQEITHHWLVVGTDSFMSNWGRAENGTSIAAWACEYDDVKRVTEWVESRGDMKRVRTVIDRKGERYSPRGHGHLHIYVVEDNHPSVARHREFQAEMAAADKSAERRRAAQAKRIAATA